MRIKSLDALRGVAAISVAIPHFLMAHGMNQWLVESWSIIAVDVFFILSGYVLAPQLLFCMQADCLGRIKTFLIRRWMRTLPPYLLALFAVGIVSSKVFTWTFLKYMLFSQNLFSLDLNDDFFSIAWSLSIEEWFYIVFPLFLLLSREMRLGTIKAAILFVVILLAIKLIGMARYTDWEQFARRLVVFRLDSICFGFLLYVLHSSLDEQGTSLAKRVAPALMIGSGLISTLIFYKIHLANTQVIEMAYFYIAPVFAGSLLVCFYFMNPVFIKIKWLGDLSTYLGEISYDVYLFHLLIIQILNRLVHLNSLWLFALYMLLLIGLSTLVRRNFEDPILALRPKYKNFQTD